MRNTANIYILKVIVIIDSESSEFVTFGVVDVGPALGVWRRGRFAITVTRSGGSLTVRRLFDRRVHLAAEPLLERPQSCLGKLMISTVQLSSQYLRQ